MLDQLAAVTLGAVSWVVGNAIWQPLEVVKVTMQVEPATRHRHRGFIETAQRIVREEGTRGLFKGNVTNMKLTATQSFIYFGFLEVMKNHTDNNIISAMVASTVATLSTYPYSLARTRLCVHDRVQIYKGSTHHVIREAWHHRKLAGIYRGVMPGLMLSVPLSTISYSCFIALKNFGTKLYGENDITAIIAISYVAAATSAASIRFLLYPFDVIMRRMQIQGYEGSSSGKAHVCTGMVSCFSHTWTKEGIRGLYRGLAPMIFKTVITTGVAISLFEDISNNTH